TTRAYRYSMLIPGLVVNMDSGIEHPPYPFGNRMKRQRVHRLVALRSAVYHFVSDGRGLPRAFDARPVSAVLDLALRKLPQWTWRTEDPIEHFLLAHARYESMPVAGHHLAAAEEPFPLALIAADRVHRSFALVGDPVARPEHDGKTDHDDEPRYPFCTHFALPPSARRNATANRLSSISARMRWRPDV